nr:MAG TPA: hypothetical protein [Caudoviricetes sp.]
MRVLPRGSRPFPRSKAYNLALWHRHALPAVKHK